MHQALTTTPDLFTSLRSKKDQLLAYIRARGRCRTSDVIRWGLDNHHTRSERDARDLAAEGKIWRMRDDIKMMVYGNIKEDVWSTYLVDKEL